MDSFLHKVASQILREHPRDTDRVLVVFNNHRSELFLRRAFEQISAAEGTTFFRPKKTPLSSFRKSPSSTTLWRNSAASR